MFKRSDYGKPQSEIVRGAKKLHNLDNSQEALNAALVQKITHLEKLPVLLQRLAQAFHTFKVDNMKIIASLHDQISKLNGTKSSVGSDFETIDAPLSPENIPISQATEDEINNILAEVKGVNTDLDSNVQSSLVVNNIPIPPLNIKEPEPELDTTRTRSSLLTRMDDGDTRVRKTGAGKKKKGKKGTKAKKDESSSSEEDN